MSPELETDGASLNELEPVEELLAITRALRAHAEYLNISGAFGVPRAEVVLAPVEVAADRTSAVPVPPRVTEPAPRVPEPAPRSTEPPPSTAPQAVAATHVAIPKLSPEETKQRLSVLASRIVGCTKCPLHERRTQTVFARGNGMSGLCFVGEGPGADEDEQGLPFVGAAGQLLDRMITAMGLSRDEVYVCNIVKCRPPENRKPLPHEMNTCIPYLREQLEILAPEVIVALGATAVEGLLGIPGGITRLRGTWKLYQGRIAVMPTFHPAYLLRAPSAKHVVWEDMQAVLRHMGRPVPSRGQK